MDCAALIALSVTVTAAVALVLAMWMVHRNNHV